VPSTVPMPYTLGLRSARVAVRFPPNRRQRPALASTRQGGDDATVPAIRSRVRLRVFRLRTVMMGQTLRSGAAILFELRTGVVEA